MQNREIENPTHAKQIDTRDNYPVTNGAIAKAASQTMHSSDLSIISNSAFTTLIWWFTAIEGLSDVK